VVVSSVGFIEILREYRIGEDITLGGVLFCALFCMLSPLLIIVMFLTQPSMLFNIIILKKKK
jgi:hypothetical protein